MSVAVHIIKPRARVSWATANQKEAVGKFPYLGRYKEMPAKEELGFEPVPEELDKKIMHVSLQRSKESSIMGSDTGGELASKFRAGNNFSVSISTDSKEEADRLFNGLSVGGIVSMPMEKSSVATISGCLPINLIYTGK